MKSSRSAFDAALQLLPAPVTVVGARCGDELGGLTAAWVTRVSLDPPRLLVAIGHERHTWALLDTAAHFTVSVLRDDQVAVARLFGLQSRRDVDKWAQVAHEMMGEGIPAVADCAARYLCRGVSRFTTGDHECFVGEIVTAETIAGGPALPMRGADYAPLADAE
jgi:flavin reductase (DIM6/NTAB) family NADH-FMN oxidoreductase RutF